jgi:hypothetical protein
MRRRGIQLEVIILSGGRPFEGKRYNQIVLFVIGMILFRVMDGEPEEGGDK